MFKISVIVVTYNNAETITQCLDSVIKYAPGVEIIVIDNNSNDSTLRLIKGIRNNIQVVETEENLGFAKANNLGVKRSSGQYLVFLNPDAMLLKQNSLEYLQRILQENPEYGLLGPRLIYSDKRVQPKVRNLPTVFRAFEEYILGIKGTYSFYEPKCQQLCEVESVSGACMIIKKDTFEKAGGFNEKYFIYYEDIELCKVVRKLGYRVGFVPEVVVEHAEGVSGENQKTNQLMKSSARSYFGFFAYYFLELIFFYNRLMNRLRKMVNHPVHV